MSQRLNYSRPGTHVRRFWDSSRIGVALVKSGQIKRAAQQTPQLEWTPKQREYARVLRIVCLMNGIPLPKGQRIPHKTIFELNKALAHLPNRDQQVNKVYESLKKSQEEFSE